MRILKKPSLIVLDEISFIKEWQRAIKAAYDSGILNECIIVACGSNAVDVKKALHT